MRHLLREGAKGGGLFYALFISLLISKLFCRKGCMGGGGDEDIICLLCTGGEGEGRGGEGE
jgi:hypothetical protein